MFQNLRSGARRFNAPVTIFLVASLLGTSLYFWGARQSGLEVFMLGSDWPNKPWTVLTYPWAYMPYGGVLPLLCFFGLLYWLWWSGSEVERTMGSLRYAVLWLVSTFLGGVFMWGAAKLLNLPWIYGGSWLPDAAITVWWCAINSKLEVRLYGTIPASTKFFAAFTAVILILVHGSYHPLIGFASALHLIPVYLLANGKFALPQPRVAKAKKMEDRPYLKKSERMDKSYYDDVNRRAKEREDREKLKKLFESSLDEDSGKDR